MPQPLSMLFAISVRSTATRSVPPDLLTMPSARACTASACFMIAAGLLIVTDLANFAASTPATLPNTIISVREFDPSRFACRIQSRQRRGRLAVGLDSAHGVVNSGQYRNRFARRIDAHEFFRQLV